ncbi:substrate-binding domain-containing protein [Luteolibacter algae]|uniref:Substrate-binding domain-containing protein n=1 Tax=Luteolibacter algae TaxID=454151 RepID=A0ABW5D6N1_9BACT
MKELKQIAVLVDSASGWGRRVIEGILSEALEHHRWHIWISPMHRKTESFLPKGWIGDGIIARIPNAKSACNLAKLKVPVVDVSSIPLPGNPYPRIMPDHEEACRLALDHFTSKGFKRFGYVGPVRLPWVQAHFAAFQKVLATHKLKGRVFSSPMDFTSQKDWQEWMDSLCQWLAEQPKPLAILAWSPRMGREVVEACRMGGIQVPHEVAILGSNSDGLLDQACHPPLAGIDEPCFEMGKLAAKYLDSLISGSADVPPLTLVKPSRIIPGGSTDTLALNDPMLVQVMKFIESHACDCGMSVETILQHVPMARRSLERKFRETFDRSPAEEIRLRRVAHAKALLLDTDLPMSEVAEACGYSTYNYLYSVFMKSTGISPTMYRAEHRSSDHC